MSNYALIAQVVCVCILVLLFIYVVKKYPIKPSVRSMVIAALLTCLAVALNAISISFGELFKISFVYLPLILAGVVLSPGYAYLVGFCMDMIGLIITPTSFPFFGFTLNHVLASTIPALYYQSARELDPKKVIPYINCILIVFALIGSFFIGFLNKASINGDVVVIDNTMKMLGITALIVLCLILVFIIRITSKKVNNEQAYELGNWMLIVVAVEVAINLILTPLWLDVMYGMPWLVSMFLRIVKACVMIPLNILIGYSLVKLLRRFK